MSFFIEGEIFIGLILNCFLESIYLYLFGDPCLIFGFSSNTSISY